MISTMSSSVIEGDRAYSPPCNAGVNPRARRAKTKCEEPRTTPADRSTCPIPREDARGGMMTVRPLPAGSTGRLMAAIAAPPSTTTPARPAATRRTRTSVAMRRTHAPADAWRSRRRNSINPLTGPAATLHHRPAAALLVVVVVWVAIAANLIVHDLDVVVLSRVLNGRSHLAKFGFIFHRHQRVTVHPEHDGRVGMIRWLQNSVLPLVNFHDVHQAELVRLAILIEQRNDVATLMQSSTPFLRQSPRSILLRERSTGGAEVSNFPAPLVTLPVEVGLEEERGRDGVSRSAPARAARPARDHRPIGLGGGETLILNLHGHRYHCAQRIDKLPDPGRGISLGPVHAQRQPDHDARGA